MLSRPLLFLTLGLSAALAAVGALAGAPNQALLGQGVWSEAPPDIQEVVRQHSTVASACLPLRARPVAIKDGFAAVVTTSAACGGSASAPLWVVATDPARVLLSDVGNGVRVAERASSNGMPNLRVQVGRGTTCAQRIWSFDGRRYVAQSPEPEPCRIAPAAP